MLKVTFPFDRPLRLLTSRTGPIVYVTIYETQRNDNACLCLADFRSSHPRYVLILEPDASVILEANKHELIDNGEC